MESLLTLANQYATRHGTKILSHRIDGDQIIFVLESGPKHTMTPASLQRALEEAGVTPDALPWHSPGLQKAIEASGVTHRPAGGVPAGEAELKAALDESQGISARQELPGTTKPAPPAETAKENETPKRKPRTK